MSKIKVLLQSL